VKLRNFYLLPTFLSNKLSALHFKKFVSAVSFMLGRSFIMIFLWGRKYGIILKFLKKIIACKI
jgi:hypothetical protein